MTTIDSTMQETKPDTSEEGIAQWLRQYIASLLALPEEKIGLDVAFHRNGLDSSAAVAMTGDLSEWLGCEIDPSAAYEHPTILKLSKAAHQECLRHGLAA